MAEQRRARKGAAEARHDDAPREVCNIGLPREEDAADSSAEDEEDPVSVERAHGVVGYVRQKNALEGEVKALRGEPATA
jgi:hypothetical protein